MALAGVAMGEMKAKEPASVAGSIRARGCLGMCRVVFCLWWFGLGCGDWGESWEGGG